MAESTLDVERLAVAYRRLVLWFGVQLAVGIFGAMAIAASGQTTAAVAAALLRLLGLLVTICALGIYAYRTASALGSRVGVLWGVAMLIPLINAVTLLVLSSRATKACREAGIEVGFLGPRIPAATTAPGSDTSAV